MNDFCYSVLRIRSIKVFILIFFITFLLVVENSFSQNKESIPERKIDLDKFFKMKKVKILITDSGLGGMSVLSGLVKNLKANPVFEEVELVFFNALPSAELKYNSFKTMEEKAVIFNEALNSMVSNFTPDIILIACNTLSVVYPFTEFSKKEVIPVLGIVDFGVEMIFERMKQNSDKIIIFGTETTISSRAHKEKLLKKGIKPKQIFVHACPDLESEIQTNPNGSMVRNMVEFYIDELSLKIGKGVKKVYAGLCCSHYGYSKEVFYDLLKQKISKNVEVINPNDGMINFITGKIGNLKYGKCIINSKVISQVELSNEEINSIVALIKDESEEGANALKNYELRKGLFKINFKY